MSSFSVPCYSLHTVLVVPAAAACNQQMGALLLAVSMQVGSAVPFPDL